jgi:hypothetical protein
MQQRVLAAALAAVLSGSTIAPAMADGAASTRNILLLGTGAGIVITKHNHKVRAQRDKQQVVERRQTAYRDWFYHKYGYYPTYEQFKKWYYDTYGVNPD